MTLLPRPACDWYISPTTMPNTARLSPNRMPRIMLGSDPGRMTLTNTSQLLAQKERAATIQTANTRRGVHQDWNNTADEGDCDLRLHSDAQPGYDDGQQSEMRSRINRHNGRIQEMA